MKRVYGNKKDHILRKYHTEFIFQNDQGKGAAYTEDHWEKGNYMTSSPDESQELGKSIDGGEN